MLGVDLSGHAMSFRIASRCEGVASANDFPNRELACVSIQARPFRIQAWLRGRSVMVKSMNSGTPASDALPDLSSFGMIMSARTRTVRYSAAVKNLGA